ncbi:MAG: hypothetical protein L3K52_05475 [Candidatus Thiothrix sulfatifontis]|nr:MAG: hypothetical protein L3K52_05475 [Candidatus Thiothrix sulfatifontis]
MGNAWYYCKDLLCFQYKSICYCFKSGYQSLDDIQKELEKNRASQTLNDWLVTDSEGLRLFVMDAKHDKKQHIRKRTASTPILLWAEVLESYLKVKHDTPSCIQLWKWAAQGHREQRKTEEELKHLNIRLERKILHFGTAYRTTYTAYRKLFTDHINTQSITPDAERRKAEKLIKAHERRVMSAKQNEK